MEQIKQKNDSHVVSYLTLRRLIGILGMALPFACWIANAIVNKFDLLNNENLAILNPGASYQAQHNLKESISHFYYTASAPMFIGILITVAIFLFCYSGYEPREDDKYKWITDKLVTTLAGIAALGIVIFPTSSSEVIIDNFFIFRASKIIGLIHLIFAASFFILMALLCLVNFRRQGDKRPFGEGEYDSLYRFCGAVILISIGIVFIYGSFLKDIVNLDLPVTFIFETVALIAFGVAWLFKGKLYETNLAKNTLKLMKSMSH
jgi:hypothetical protein